MFAGNDLFLFFSRRVVTEGDELRLSSRGGVPGSLAALFLTRWNSQPTSVLVDFGLLDGDGIRTFLGKIPAGLAGIDLTFHSWSTSAVGSLIDSADTVISIE